MHIHYKNKVCQLIITIHHFATIEENWIVCESIYGRIIVSFEKMGTKNFSRVFISNMLPEQRSKNGRKTDELKHIFFFNFKFSSFTDSAWQQEGASLQL